MTVKYELKKFPIKLTNHHINVCEIFFQNMLKIGIDLHHRVKTWKVEAILEHELIKNLYEYFNEQITIETSISLEELEKIKKENDNPFKAKNFGVLCSDNSFYMVWSNEDGTIKRVETKDLSLETPEGLNVKIRKDFGLNLVVKFTVV